MQAVLTEPIVTDYSATVKSPWLLVLIAVVLLALVMPREVLPEFLVASGVVCAVVATVSWFLTQLFRTRSLESAE